MFLLLSCVFFAPYISARFRAFLCIQMHPSQLTSSHLLRIIRALLLILRAFWHILRASFTTSRAQPACAFCAIHSTPTSLMCTRDAFCICIPTSHSVRIHVHLGSISHLHFVRTQAHCMCFLAHSVQLAVLLACLALSCPTHAVVGLDLPGAAGVARAVGLPPLCERLPSPGSRRARCT